MESGEIREERLRELFWSLVEIYSPSGKEEAALGYLEEFLSEQGCPYGVQPVDEDRYNLLLGDPEAAVVLVGHVDTVDAWDLEDYGPRDLGEGWIGGLGTADMKGGCAAILEAYLCLRAQGLGREVGVALVVGEEEDGDGADAFLGEFRPGRAVVGEPTDLVLCTGHYGYLEVEISAEGRRPRQRARAGPQRGRAASDGVDRPHGDPRVLGDRSRRCRLEHPASRNNQPGVRRAGPGGGVGRHPRAARPGPGAGAGRRAAGLGRHGRPAGGFRDRGPRLLPARGRPPGGSVSPGGGRIGGGVPEPQRCQPVPPLRGANVRPGAREPGVRPRRGGARPVGPGHGGGPALSGPVPRGAGILRGVGGLVGWRSMSSRGSWPFDRRPTTNDRSIIRIPPVECGPGSRPEGREMTEEVMLYDVEEAAREVAERTGLAVEAVEEILEADFLFHCALGVYEIPDDDEGQEFMDEVRRLQQAHADLVPPAGTDLDGIEDLEDRLVTFAARLTGAEPATIEEVLDEHILYLEEKGFIEPEED
ncbi:MAG: M20 family metallopeptidase [Deltaproteobacteria bacterium]|nr:M20 family metallopeptidase [Deltaproteobacteria bacterium]